ncbi:3-hydroxyacyl-CoA dehydrogenase NAD-binding domain-containing protein, partial [Variovorax sp. CT11-76]
MANEPVRFAAVGAGRMGHGIAIAFAYAGHRIALVDLRVRSEEAWNKGTHGRSGLIDKVKASTVDEAAAEQ